MEPIGWLWSCWWGGLKREDDLFQAHVHYEIHSPPRNVTNRVGIEASRSQHHVLKWNVSNYLNVFCKNLLWLFFTWDQLAFNQGKRWFLSKRQFCQNILRTFSMLWSSIICHQDVWFNQYLDGFMRYKTHLMIYCCCFPWPFSSPPWQPVSATLTAPCRKSATGRRDSACAGRTSLDDSVMNAW